MENKTVLITGATAGIGLETAKALVKRGAQVNFIARNEIKAREAQKLLQDLGNGREVRYYIADLSKQRDVRQVAGKIKKDLPVIDVLLNNAGCVYRHFELSEDSIEMTMATNHFAYFLLTMLLLDEVKAAEKGRIVNVASESADWAKIDFESFTKKKSYFIMKAYGQSKLANIMFTKSLSEQLKGTQVTVNCLHPGRVKTKIGEKNTDWLASSVWNMFVNLTGVSVEEGAKTSIYLASSTEVEGVTGKYFSRCKPIKYNRLVNDEKLRQRLWDKTLELCPIE